MNNGNHNMSAINRFPFTASQWQELEHQALIFKYMVSGIPVPPDLLFTIKRSYYFDRSPPSAAKHFTHQHQHVEWNCFQVGLGRKIDPEPGRCRRTDGKKWRCSKEAYPDSKYCERHMHRGKNRSRKPVELNTSTCTANKSSSALFYSSAKHQESFNLTHLVLDSGSGSGSGSQSNTDLRSRYVYGPKEEVDEHAFFSEPSGKRSFSGLQSDYSDLQLKSCADNTPKQQDKQPEEIPQKTVHRFFDEWPPKSRDSWLDLDDKSSKNASLSTASLSISIPSSHDFPIFSSRAP
ncbi:Growth-regulating factor 6 [Citrus sinensis]|uniref:Growth-regulating factor 6 n=1 Tax=Citrus sinensis TaxID=2711 RepID=A0ACB8NVU8_CITSI|nr:Growth-regulating factor 6 [Citrus sinensis]